MEIGNPLVDAQLGTGWNAGESEKERRRVAA